MLSEAAAGEYRPGDDDVAIIAISKAPRPKSLSDLEFWQVYYVRYS